MVALPLMQLIVPDLEKEIMAQIAFNFCHIANEKAKIIDKAAEMNKKNEEKKSHNGINWQSIKSQTSGWNRLFGNNILFVCTVLPVRDCVDWTVFLPQLV